MKPTHVYIVPSIQLVRIHKKLLESGPDAPDFWERVRAWINWWWEWCAK